MALPINIRLGRKGLAGTNTLAYFEHSKITALGWRYDTQHKDTQHNDIQNNDTQHNGFEDNGK